MALEDLKIVATRFEHSDLIVTVEGPRLDEVTSAQARALVWKERLSHGMDMAGLEGGDHYPCNKEGVAASPGASIPAEELMFRKEYTLHRGRI